MHPDRIIPQQTNKDVKSVWNCWSLHTHTDTGGRATACIHSIIHERRWIIHGYYVSRRKLQTTSTRGTEENKRTSSSSVCPDALTSGDLVGRMISAGREDGWNVEVTFELHRLLSARCERGSYHPSIRLPLTFTVSHKHIKRPVIAPFLHNTLSEGCQTNA